MSLSTVEHVCYGGTGVPRMEKFKQEWEWEGRRRKKEVGDKPKPKYFKILNGIYYFVS